VWICASKIWCPPNVVPHTEIDIQTIEDVVPHTEIVV
jgi:hypothetical protein